MCRTKHLLKRGYTRLAPTEFRPPDGGPVLLLDKPSRYGARLRAGKLGDRYMPGSVHGIRGIIMEGSKE